jgi:hypothetical protein
MNEETLAQTAWPTRCSTGSSKKVWILPKLHRRHLISKRSIWSRCIESKELHNNNCLISNKVAKAVVSKLAHQTNNKLWWTNKILTNKPWTLFPTTRVGTTQPWWVTLTNIMWEMMLMEGNYKILNSILWEVKLERSRKPFHKRSCLRKTL